MATSDVSEEAVEAATDALWSGPHGEDGWRTADVRAALAAAAPHLRADAARAHGRADLAEARLGQIFDALEDYDGRRPGDLIGDFTKFTTAIRAALAWTPDDTATADFYEPDEPVANVQAAFDAGEKGTTGRRGWNVRLDPTAPAGAATGEV